MKQVMKFFIVISICVSVVAMYSCNKSTNSGATGELKFSMSLGKQLKSLSLSDTAITDTASNYAALVTILDSKGNVVYKLKRLTIYNFGGQYTSESLSLEVGSYKLTEFMILKGSSVEYAAPVSGSPRAQLINYPLPIEFQIAESSSTLVKPEVLNAAVASPQEFGYSSFSFTIVGTTFFKIIAYGSSSDTTHAVQALLRINLTSFSDSIRGHDTINVVSKTLEYELASIINTIEVTNAQKYALTVSKSGYQAWSRIYTLSELNSFATNPLKVYLSKLVIPKDTLAVVPKDTLAVVPKDTLRLNHGK